MLLIWVPKNLLNMFLRTGKKISTEIPNCASHEVHCKQVKTCIQIARRCMESDRRKRPAIKDIVSQFDEIEPEILIFHSGKLDFGWPCSEDMNVTVCRGLNSSKCGNVYNDPPSEISHAAHREHKLRLITAAVAPFLCDGCKEPGYGPRYTCDCGGGGRTFNLHTRCALAGDPLFGLHTLVHPLFGYGEQFEFRFLQEAPTPSPVSEGRTRVCDACGEPTSGYVYHCSAQDVDIHPCCASLPDRIIQDGRAFDLHRRASRPCGLCPDDESQRHLFWAYRGYVDDGEEAATWRASRKRLAAAGRPTTETRTTRVTAPSECRQHA